MKILAIDPGPEKSAFVAWDSEEETIFCCGIYTNEFVKDQVIRILPDSVCIEMVACYGMPVGKEVFETCLWIGRFTEAVECLGVNANLIFRRDIKLHLCNSVKAKDSNIRQALIDRFGAVGTKKAPGKLYGIKSHLWAALAVAVYQADKLNAVSNNA
jgi:hypothetical protein